MLKEFTANIDVDFKFNRENLKNLAPYFDLNFPDSTLDDKVQFFKNIRALSQKSLGLAHCIQHNAVPRIAVQLSNSAEARANVLSKQFDELIGCYSVVKRSDELTFINNVLDGRKQWFSNLTQADYGVLQVAGDEGTKLVYFNLHTLAHEIDDAFFEPIGMELAQAGTLVVHNQPIKPENILGMHGTQQYFQQSNFASYCFLSNHCGLIVQLFKDIRDYATKNKCGAEFELKKIEMDVGTLVMQWQDNLPTVGETIHSNEFWNRRNTQYAYSKKTLISIIKLILEIGVTYYLDAKSPFSQRFRDAITYASHMHPLYRFGQEFIMLNLEDK